MRHERVERLRQLGIGGGIGAGDPLQRPSRTPCQVGDIEAAMLAGQRLAERAQRLGGPLDVDIAQRSFGLDARGQWQARSRSAFGCFWGYRRYRRPSGSGDLVIALAELLGDLLVQLAPGGVLARERLFLALAIAAEATEDDDEGRALDTGHPELGAGPLHELESAHSCVLLSLQSDVMPRPPATRLAVLLQARRQDSRLGGALSRRKTVRPMNKLGIGYEYADWEADR